MLTRKKSQKDIRSAWEVFNEDEASLVHNDLHMGNILHIGEELSAILDFDSAVKAPQVSILTSLLGFVHYPEQFVEGTPYFDEYKGKNFLHLLPTLKNELAEVFTDKKLLRKLNLLFISEGIMWIADNWSEEWNKEMISGIVRDELPDHNDELNNTYYGKVLRKS
jgi:5-methylthioribose kinase